MTDTPTGTADLIKRLRAAKANGDPSKYIAGITVADAHAAADALEAAERERVDLHKLLQDEQFYTGHSPSTRKAFALADLRIRELEANLEAAGLLMDREFIDRHGDPVVTSNAALQEILHLRGELETAEMVIAPVATAFSKRVENPKLAQARRDWNERMPGAWPIELTLTMDNGRQARDWLARHATGQRKGGEDDPAPEDTQ